MQTQAKVTRREIWVDMLMYPRHTLPTAFAPALIAAALAYHNEILHLPTLFSAFMAGWLIQLGGVITDNYNNLTRHPNDREHAKFVQGLRQGLVTLSELRTAITACYLIAILFGLYLASLGGWTVILIGVASIFASLAYSTKPYPLGDHALGEPLFFIFFGPVSLAGYYFVQAAVFGSTPFTIPVLFAGLGVAALTTNILVIDNIRDMDYDKEKSEITITVLIGRKWSFVEYCILFGAAYIFPLLLWLQGSFGWGILLVFLSIPYGINVALHLIRSQTFEERIPLTPQAGQVLLLYSFLFSVGVLLV
ncbi:MAG: 1,4-dihydroxy-2-naphthoate octaprenyltransferase [Anaerolineales bacterium]|nr:1,4-dihydroxy-2-naphthoate octaprenyltransferase [Anaerolineales bacterium]MCB9145920.1 1,4-dihydroxy-2-naphthoate octaprenyltransferase [Anaerolineales bacterium]